MSLWGKDADPIRPISPGERLHCLACGASGPFSSLDPCGIYAIRDGRLVGEVNGVRVSCCRCAAQFVMCSDGAFQHHAQAEPFTGSARPTNAPPPQLEAQEPNTQPPRVPWPEARQKPSY